MRSSERGGGLVEKRAVEKPQVLMGCNNEERARPEGMGWLEGMVVLLRQGHFGLCFPTMMMSHMAVITGD